MLDARADFAEGVVKTSAICHLVLGLQPTDCVKSALCIRHSALMFCTLAGMQAKQQSVSAEDFRLAVLSGTQFVDMTKNVDSVGEYAVPPGAPSMVDTTLKGLNELGCLLWSCAAQWWVQAGLLSWAAVMQHR